jgi:pimeloyl-ACP methyl ester carboxylesterase
MPLLTVDEGIDVYYSDHGSGPAVLMLHGWGCDGGDWIWLATDFAVDHRVIVIDQRGHGQSTPTAGPYGVKVLADDAAKLLRHLSIEKAVVVGHSMGGLIASALAVEYPELVSALVLVDPGYGYTDETTVPIIAALRQRPAEAARDVFARMYVDTSPPWQRLWHERRLGTIQIALIAELFCACYEGDDGVGHRTLSGPYLSRRQCPVLSVHSGTSAALIAPWERSLPHRPDDLITEWNGCGHFIHQERPEEFAALARSWLARLS